MDGDKIFTFEIVVQAVKEDFMGAGEHELLRISFITLYCCPAAIMQKHTGEIITGNIVLQHGSILCGGYHKNICNYLDLPVNTSSELKEEMNNTTTDLNEILNKNIDMDNLADSIKNGFAKHFNIKRFNYKKEFKPASTLY